MIDEVRVLRLLRSVTDDLAVLKVEARAEADRRADPIWLRGVKYTFVTAIEACIDVAQHMCSAQGWGPPKDNGDAMAILGGRGVLDAPLSEQMRRAVGFRNVLVHEYVEVDDSVVVRSSATPAIWPTSWPPSPTSSRPGQSPTNRAVREWPARAPGS